MKAGGGLVFGVPRAAALPTLFLRRRRSTFRCCSSSSSSSSSSDHVSFIKDVAAAQPPEHLHHLLKMLQVRGESIISPAMKQRMIPLAIPLSKNNLGSVTALLRWPTAPPGMEMPVVEVRSYGVWLLAKTVGLFPDILECKVMNHFKKGDHVSAMVTGEFYTKKDHFPGFGRPFVFNAEVLLKVGRNPEAKDAARGALKSPWWTLGCPYQEVAEIAEWDDEQIEFIKEKVSEEGKQEDLMKGKDAAQISLDEAAFLLDLASIEGTWDEKLDRIAECYLEAGLPEIAKFVKYAD
ncbi:hypothetical protein L1987_51339 [Smallanthus sonchifolius]|uniref:Uncharacterized protein n=1 Tax=Smallanthus sonchifolius TaxID=185202 RepID=A0ACB9EQ72_9ASTR|nr:hypothetical protein L1987_51339 [Smallanthus sonchifolius]